MWVSCLFVSAGVLEEDCGAGCPVHVYVRCGTVLVGQRGMYGTLWFGAEVAGSTVRYRINTGGIRRYITAWYGTL